MSANWVMTIAACLVSVSAACATKEVTESLKLTADEDWRGQGVVKLAEGVTIDLNGHTLQTDGLIGPDEPFEDATTADPSRVTLVSPASLYAGDATFLFDNNFIHTASAGERTDPAKNHRICTTDMPFTLDYDFGEPTCIDSYRIYFQSLGSGNDRAPMSWTFSGSDDGTTWKTLDTHTDESNWPKPSVRRFAFSNLASYRYYRLNITKHGSANCMEIYQLEYFKARSGTVDLTLGPNDASSASTLFAGDVKCLFDNNFTYSKETHRICAQKTYAPIEIDYDFGTPTVVNAYKLYFNSVGNGNDRAPRDWTVLGSNDKQAWTELERRFRETEWKKPDVRFFEFDNVTPYRYYRLAISEFMSDVLELYQIEYFNLKAKVVTHCGTGVDETKSDESKVIGDEPSYGGSSKCLFDDSFTYSSDHRICNQKYPYYVGYDFGEGNEIVIDTYRMYYKGNGPGRSPRAWTFEGSDDNERWDVLDTHADEAAWTDWTMHEFTVAEPRPYRYFRLNITAHGTAGNCLELYQLEFLSHASGGHLTVSVGEGQSVTNESVSFLGNFDLTKDGPGEFAQVLGGQTRTGTFTLNDGTFAVLQNDRWMNVPMTLNGGTLKLDLGTQMDAWNAFPQIVLGGDAALELACTTRIGRPEGGVLDLGGHTLAMLISKGAELRLDAREVRNGTVRVDGDPSASFYFPSEVEMSAPTANFDLNCMYRCYMADVAVSNLTVRAPNSQYTIHALLVNGVFKPLTQGFQDTVLQDGSSLDLTEWEGTFSTASTTQGRQVTFAPGATVTVNLWGRKPHRGEQIVAWETPPENVTFKIDAASLEKGYDVEVRDGGIYFVNNRGMVILFR